MYRYCRCLSLLVAGWIGLVLYWVGAGGGLAWAGSWVWSCQVDETSTPAWAEIHVVDAETGRGVPLVELETVNGLLFVTDNHGRVAVAEPSLLEREVYFHVRSHGYQYPADGFGSRGIRLTLVPGAVAKVSLPRTMPAERICRLTGEGRFRDSRLLGYSLRPDQWSLAGNVAGQDSIVAAEYRGDLYCFWGDTQQLKYPLGLFRVAGATATNAMAADRFDEATGLIYDYFVDEETGFARAMMPYPEHPEGVIWISGLCVVTDQTGNEKMVAHYSRRRGLAEELEQGICVFADDSQQFESVLQLPPAETWRKPTGHPIDYVDPAGRQWLLFGSPTPNVRVPANLDAVLDSSQYEALTCAAAGSAAENLVPQLTADGQPNWRWQRDLPPVGSATEAEWVRDGKLPAGQARYYPADAADADARIRLHSGTVRWNEYRQRWILIACQVFGDSSMLGEVWYGEADSPTGPFERCVKVLTHDRQSFYNVCQHAFLDRDAGRIIYFEGTYTSMFSGNPHQTPRYNYNQVLYRLDLDHPALQVLRED